MNEIGEEDLDLDDGLDPELADLLIARGVKPELLTNVEFLEDGDRPSVYIGDEYPELTPELLLHAAQHGMELTFVFNDVHCDLEPLIPAIRLTPSIRMYGPPTAYSHITSLEQAANVDKLVLKFTPSEPIDLSSLPRIRTAEIESQGDTLLERNPNIRGLSIERWKARSELPVTARLQRLSISGRSFSTDLSFISDMSALQEIHIEGATSVDLASLENARDLRFFTISSCKSVTGFKTLEGAPKLHRIWLRRVQQIDHPETLLALHLTDLDTFACPAIDRSLYDKLRLLGSKWMLDEPRDT